MEVENMGIIKLYDDFQGTKVGFFPCIIDLKSDNDEQEIDCYEFIY